MSRTRNRFATAAVAAAGLFSAVLALSPTAAADPAAPTSPGVPGLDVLQQFASPPSVSQLLQSAASVLNGGNATATPAAAAPTAIGALSPQPAASAPGASTVVTRPLPAVGAVSSPATGGAGSVPRAPLNLPPGAAVPAPPPSQFQLSLPGNLSSLVPGGVLPPNLGTNPVAAPAPSATAVPRQTGPAAPFPISVLP